MTSVLITPPVLRDLPGEHTRILEEAGLEVCYPASELGSQLTESDVLANLEGHEASLAGPEPYTERVFERFPHLRVISRAGVGYDAVDLEAASGRGIAVCYTPGTNHDAVAEHTMALLLGMTRRVVQNHLMVAGGEFKRTIMPPLRGRTLGIVGYGRIGRAVAARALAFGMQCITFDPYADAAATRADGVERVTLEELTARSDYITLHTPLTEETRHLVREESLRSMKEGVMLINTARGGLVDESALTAALQTGKVAAAAVDVYADEPPVGSPLFDAPNMLFSPHIASMDTDAIDQMAVMAAQSIADLFLGEWPADRIVNAERLGPGWKWQPS